MGGFTLICLRYLLLFLCLTPATDAFAAGQLGKYKGNLTTSDPVDRLMTKLYGVTLGENCSKYLNDGFKNSAGERITIQNEEPIVEIRCGKNNNKVFAIYAHFTSTSYSELKRFLIKEIGSYPSSITPDETMPEDALFNKFRTGKAIWETASLVEGSSLPVIELTIENTRAWGTYKKNNYDSSLELISWKLSKENDVLLPKRKNPLENMLN